MFLSPSSLITTLIISNISIVIIGGFLKDYKRILQISIGALLSGILLLLLRLLIPFEFTFQYTIFEKHIFPRLFALLFAPVVEFNRFKIYSYHIFLMIWGLGVVIIGIKTIFTYKKFKRLMRETGVKEDSIMDIINNEENFYKKSSKLSVIRTNVVSVPLIFGILNPQIVLPCIELSDKELFYIIKHEAAHYYYHDLWIKLFVEIISILYWWNPLVYTLKQQIDKILEIRVDTSVTKKMDQDERINYLNCLLTIAKGNAPTHINDFSLAFDSRAASFLSQRFYIVLDNNLERKSGMKSSILFLVIVFIITSASFIIIEPYSIHPKDQKQTVELTADNAYLIVNQSNGYDIYLNNEYFGTVSEIKDSYSDLHIYPNIKEALFYEKEK